MPISPALNVDVLGDYWLESLFNKLQMQDRHIAVLHSDIIQRAGHVCKREVMDFVARGVEIRQKYPFPMHIMDFNNCKKGLFTRSTLNKMHILNAHRILSTEYGDSDKTCSLLKEFLQENIKISK